MALLTFKAEETGVGWWLGAGVSGANAGPSGRWVLQVGVGAAA
jgi:hypothetical protein